MRTASIEIGGKAHLLCFSARVVRAVTERYGGVERIDTALSADDPLKALDEAVWLLSTMMDGGARYARLNEIPNAPALTADELLDKAERFRSYWGKEGGITVSGGEALLQIDFLIDLFRKAHERGINTNLDTSGQPFTREEPFFSKFNELLKYTDLVMLDIKHIDDEEHKKLTGHTNKNILDCARYLSEQGIPMWIRHVLVPGITDNDEYLKKTREFIDTLDTVMKVEVLPYHTLGEYKWKELGIPYKLEGVEPPTEERIQNAKKILEFNKYK